MPRPRKKARKKKVRKDIGFGVAYIRRRVRKLLSGGGAPGQVVATLRQGHSGGGLHWGDRLRCAELHVTSAEGIL